MPTYTARCEICGFIQDIALPMSQYANLPRHCGTKMSRVFKSPQIVRDIEPYQAVAVDVATGKPPRIGSRREHKEFLQRNNYVEVGNEILPPKVVEHESAARDIKAALDTVRRRKP